jgi:hypothetical protein
MSDIEIDIDNELEKEIAEIQNKELAEVKDQIKDIDVMEDEDVMKQILIMTQNDRKMADDLYKVFEQNVKLGMDRSEASKETMAKALELKILASKNLIEMMKVKNSKKDTGNVNIGIFTPDSAITPKKANIDITHIKENL